MSLTQAAHEFLGAVKTATGGYALGFALLALMALACLAALIGLRVGAQPR
jgi:hypothetical protein